MPESAFFRETSERLRALQEQLCAGLSRADGRPFGRDEWSRAEGGGGVTRVIDEARRDVAGAAGGASGAGGAADGAAGGVAGGAAGAGVFEKAAVLFSSIRGKRLPEAVLHEQPDVPPDAEFSAAGVSLICHPRNPHVPTVHFNVRTFECGPVFWYGGGMDLTPVYAQREDCIHFHRTIKGCCDRFDPAYYPRFKAWCDRYFYLKHRAEARGIGGIFFNTLKGERAAGREFILALGETFLAAYLPIVERRRGMDYGERQRAFQLYRRGRYVEFNLMYDQGTLFGLQSGGRIESILASLPPRVAWVYDWRAQPGSPEDALVRDFLPPQDWATAQP